MLPGILNHLGPEGLSHLKRFATSVASNSKMMSSLGEKDEDEKDDIPDLVENFETVMNTGASGSGEHREMVD